MTVTETSTESLSMWTLGLNWKWHDPSAALVDGDGRVWAMAEEERFTRIRHGWDSYPRQAAQFCLQTAGISWRDIDHVAIGWDLPRRMPPIPWGRAEEDELFEAVLGPDATGRDRPKLVFVNHHLAHACSAFHASGFKQAGVLVVDGAGEDQSISIFRAEGPGQITLEREWSREFSLGAMYEGATLALGFQGLNAGKTMGLSSYAAGAADLLPIGDLLEEARPTLTWPKRMDYIVFAAKWMRYLEDRFGKVTAPTGQLEQDPVAVQVAASAQRTVELSLRALHAETVSLTDSPQVCVAGGVALNCVANGLLPEPLYIPPFPHDGGVALGAAWWISPPVTEKRLESPYLGTDILPGQEINRLGQAGFDITSFSPQSVATLLLDGMIGAIAEGRAEVGPRALGHRSIIAIPRPSAVRTRINTLKGREQWRPLAPITLPGHSDTWWPSQHLRDLYMVGGSVVSSQARKVLPAAIHVDGTTRPQVLPSGQAPVVQSVLEELRRLDHAPVLVNTSFNGPGQPIVDSAADAAATFSTMALDFLILGDHLVTRKRR